MKIIIPAKIACTYSRCNDPLSTDDPSPCWDTFFTDSLSLSYCYGCRFGGLNLPDITKSIGFCNFFDDEMQKNNSRHAQSLVIFGQPGGPIILQHSVHVLSHFLSLLT